MLSKGAVPLKALRKSELKDKNSTEPLPPSGHEVILVEFIDFDDQLKEGFFKPTGETYPILSIQLTLLANLITWLSTGNCTARDRLVVDNKGNIVGSLSLKQNEFVPMLGYGEIPPEDDEKKRLKCPSTQELLQAPDLVRMLVAIARHENDDTHNGNLGLKAHIDFDMFFYRIMRWLRGPRYAEGIIIPSPDKVMSLRGHTIDDFPVLDDTRTFFPTNKMPGNLNYYKIFYNYKDFRQLARNPSYKEDGKTITFQDKMFQALLQELLSHDTEVLKEQLKQHFGDITLHFDDLSEKVCADLAKNCPAYFDVSASDYQNLSKKAALQKKFKKTTAVDFLLKFEQDLYDEFYRVAVFKLQNKNRYGVLVPSFAEALSQGPDAFRECLENIGHTRNHVFVDEKKAYCSAHNETYDRKQVVRFKPGNFEKLYHQIYRDAHIPEFAKVFEALRQFIREMAADCNLTIEMPKTYKKEAQDTKVIQALCLIDSKSRMEINSSTITDKSFRLVLDAMVCMANDFLSVTETYYLVEKSNLETRDNTFYVKSIKDSVIKCQDSVKKLLKAIGYDKKFKTVKSHIQRFCINIDLKKHFSLEKNRDLREIISPLAQRKHTDPEIMQECIATLFDWLDSVCPADQKAADNGDNVFLAEIENVIFHQYKGDRGAKEELSVYLKTNRGTGGDKLACILATPKTGQYENSLNTLLLIHMLKVMLKARERVVGDNLWCVRDAFDKDEFQWERYLHCCIRYATNDQRFSHEYSTTLVRQFEVYLYEWINYCSAETIRTCIQKTLDDYTTSVFNPKFFFRTRVPEVTGILTLLDEDKITKETAIAKIFAGADITSFNQKLFKQLLDIMPKAQAPSEKKFIIYLQYIIKMAQTHIVEPVVFEIKEDELEEDNAYYDSFFK